VFVGEGKKNGLLRHEIDKAAKELQAGSKESLKGPCSLPWVRS
jgi:hypothetical protein